MKKDCIHDFIEAWREFDGTDPRLHPWEQRFRDAGYYRAGWGGVNWIETQEWCRKYIGERHYAWVGNNFWFETEKDAIQFMLRWS